MDFLLDDANVGVEDDVLDSIAREIFGGNGNNGLLSQNHQFYNNGSQTQPRLNIVQQDHQWGQDQQQQQQYFDLQPPQQQQQDGMGTVDITQLGNGLTSSPVDSQLSQLGSSGASDCSQTSFPEAAASALATESPSNDTDEHSDDGIA